MSECGHKTSCLSFGKLSWGKKLTLATLLLLVFFTGIQFAGYWKTYRYYALLALENERDYNPSVTHSELKPREEVQGQGIVVLTGDRHRIRLAVALLIQNQGPFLIISGTGKGATLTDLMNAQTVSSLDYPSVWQKIILETQSTSTVENAMACTKMLREKKVNRVVLVTSDYHMSRALALFKKFSPEIQYTVFPTPSELTDALQGKRDWTFEGLSKFGVEFLKESLFTFYLPKN